jgi:hypothetical protein
MHLMKTSERKSGFEMQDWCPPAHRTENYHLAGGLNGNVKRMEQTDQDNAAHPSA